MLQFPSKSTAVDSSVRLYSKQMTKQMPLQICSVHKAVSDETKNTLNTLVILQINPL